MRQASFHLALYVHCAITHSIDQINQLTNEDDLLLQKAQQNNLQTYPGGVFYYTCMHAYLEACQSLMFPHDI